MTSAGEVWRTPAEEWRLQERLSARKKKGGGDLDSGGHEEAAAPEQHWGDPAEWSTSETWTKASRVMGSGWRGFVSLALVHGATWTLASMAPHVTGFRELLPLALAFSTALLLHLLAISLTVCTIRTGVPPGAGELLVATLRRVPGVTALAALTFLGLFPLGELPAAAMRALPIHAGILVVALSAMATVRAGIFAVPALVAEGGSPFEALVASWRATRGFSLLVLELAGLYLVTWMVLFTAFPLAACLVFSCHATPPLLLLAVPAVWLVLSWPGLWACTVWTLCYLRERERSRP